MPYEPEYSDGEIIVEYSIDSMGRIMAGHLGVQFGVELVDYHEPTGFLYKIERGKEDEAVEKIKENGTFVRAVYRRDLKFERRYSSINDAISSLESRREDLSESENCCLEDAINGLTGLRDMAAELDDPEYDSRLNEFAPILEKYMLL